MLGLRFCARAFSTCGKWGPLFIALRRPLTIAASLVAEHRLQMPRLSSCGSRAQLLRGMWDLPRPGLEPVSPALAGRLSTTAPPGKPPDLTFFYLHTPGCFRCLSVTEICKWMKQSSCRAESVLQLNSDINIFTWEIVHRCCLLDHPFNTGGCFYFIFIFCFHF